MRGLPLAGRARQLIPAASPSVGTDESSKCVQGGEADTKAIWQYAALLLTAKQSPTH
jgi:hypothetical protein